MKNYAHLQDKEFLKYMDTLKISEYYVKIGIYGWNTNNELNEERLLEKEIQGVVTGGNLNINGQSSMRRTCSLTLAVKDDFFEKDQNATVEDTINSIIALNKKAKVEIGLKNNLILTDKDIPNKDERQKKQEKYNQYFDGNGFVWYPLGFFVITSVTISHTINQYNISLQLKDKMCLLNGEVGGIIPAPTRFDEYDVITDEGAQAQEKPIISRIIREAVNHFGGEDAGLIDMPTSKANQALGIPDRIPQIMRWNSINPLQIIRDPQGEAVYTTEDPGDTLPAGYEKFEFTSGQDVGYILTDFYYPNELMVSAGGNVCEVLDKIKNLLGNQEQYYDVLGVFHFKQKRNQLNIRNENTENGPFFNITNVDILDYIPDMSAREIEYDFTNSDIERNIITSYNNAPKYNMIKNDFVVWGKRKLGTNSTISIRFHLAIDDEPVTALNIPDDKIIVVELTENSQQGNTLRFLNETLEYHSDTNKITYLSGQIINKKLLSQNAIYKLKNYQDFNIADAHKFDVYYGYDITTDQYRIFYTQEYINYVDDLVNGFWADFNKRYSPDNPVSIDAGPPAQSGTTEDNDNINTGEDSQGNIYPAIVKYREIRRSILNHGVDILKENPPLNKNVADGFDYRSRIQLQGYQDLINNAVSSGINDSKTSIYFRELMNEWPKIYNIIDDEWIAKIQQDNENSDALNFNPDDIDFYLDLITTDKIEQKITDINKMSVDQDAKDKTIKTLNSLKNISITKIGRRTKVINDDSVNCMFEPTVPDYILIQGGRDEETMQELQQAQDNCEGKKYTIVKPEVQECLAVGGTKNSAFFALQDLLYQYTSYNESITIQCLPIFHLEPNTLIYVKDEDSGIEGKYEIVSMSIPLTVNGTMSIQATRVLEKI